VAEYLERLAQRAIWLACRTHRHRAGYSARAAQANQDAGERRGENKAAIGQTERFALSTQFDVVLFNNVIST
jgi:hypothetical protein